MTQHRIYCQVPSKTECPLLFLTIFHRNFHQKLVMHSSLHFLRSSTQNVCLNRSQEGNQLAALPKNTSEPSPGTSATIGLDSGKPQQGEAASNPPWKRWESWQLQLHSSSQCPSSFYSHPTAPTPTQQSGILPLPHPAAPTPTPAAPGYPALSITPSTCSSRSRAS